MSSPNARKSDTPLSIRASCTCGGRAAHSQQRGPPSMRHSFQRRGGIGNPTRRRCSSRPSAGGVVPKQRSNQPALRYSRPTMTARRRCSTCSRPARAGSGSRAVPVEARAQRQPSAFALGRLSIGPQPHAVVIQRRRHAGAPALAARNRRAGANAWARAALTSEQRRPPPGRGPEQTSGEQPERLRRAVVRTRRAGGGQPRPAVPPPRPWRR